MVEECVCIHYRADHDLNADWCKRCSCKKFRLGRLVDVQSQLKALVMYGDRFVDWHKMCDPKGACREDEQGGPLCRSPRYGSLAILGKERVMQIRFDGPPGPTSGHFIEVEDDRGRSIKVGEWRQEGPDWLLVIPDIDNQLEVRLCPSQDPNGECNAVNEAIGRSEDLERRLESELSARLQAQR